jgi:hypothetical protein
MSLSVVPIETVAVNVPVLDINEPREYVIMKGGNYVQYKQYTSTSYSANSFQFSCPPPSEKILVNRKVYLQAPVTLNFTGSVSGATETLLNSGFDAPRAFPLSTNLNTVSVTINNATVNINMGDVIQALLRYNNPECLKEYDYSITPTEMDESQEYNELANTIRNVLSDYGNSNYGNTHRGAFPFTIISNTDTTASVSFVATEPIFLSPFYYGKGDHSGFYGVRTMDFNFTWNSDLSRLWSHNPTPTGGTSTITGVTVNFGQPKLLFEYTTPPITMERPLSIAYPYYVVNRFPTGPTNIPASTTASNIVSNNIQLNSIPRRMYIYLREQNSDLTINKTDSFASIENISLQFENFSGLLASASKQDLYNIARNNGLNLSWTEWSGGPTFVGDLSTAVGTVGSVLCLEPGKDFGLPDNLAPGVIGNFMMQISVIARNPNPSRAINYMLYITTVDEGTATIMDGSCILQGAGVISGMDVLNAKKQTGISYHDAHDAQGAGRFFSNIKHGVHKLKHHMSPHIMHGGVPVGGVSVGGALMSRNHLKDRLKHI